jgi:hypothetical protein
MFRATFLTASLTPAERKVKQGMDPLDDRYTAGSNGGDAAEFEEASEVSCCTANHACSCC